MAGSRARRLAVGAPVVAFVVALLVFGIVNDGPASPAGERPSAGARAPVGTDATIAALQARVRAGTEPVPLAALGGAYLQKVRETGDTSFYERAEDALDAALERDPADLDAVIGLGTLALARHDFRAALSLGRRAQRLAPAAVSPLPVVVDAQVELGRYGRAARTLQRLLNRKPGVPAYARASYLRELRGDYAGALQAMRLAVSAAGGAGEGAAYVRTLLGSLHFDTGDLSRARMAYRAALSAEPGFPAALAGLARTDAAGGRLGTAIGRLREVVQRLPLPEHVVALGEAQLAAGRRSAARRDFALMGAQRRLIAASGADADLEFALFEADHGDAPAGVEIARGLWAEAPSVRSADALGWALTRAGRPSAGFRWARRALRHGWSDPRALYHAGMSARAAGRPGEARRLLTRLLEQSPRFSALYGPRARRALEGLQPR